MKRVVAWVLLGLFLLLCVCLFCLAAAVALIRPDWFPFDIPGISRDRIVLRLPDGGLEADYLLLRPGQAVDRGRPLAEDALEPSTTLWRMQTAQGLLSFPVQFGIFLPESDLLLYRVQGDETSLHLLGRRWREPQMIFESEEAGFSVMAFNGGERIFLVEEQASGRVRCYLSQDGREAERMARGDACEVSANGATLLVSDTSGGGLTLAAMNLDGSEEVVLLDEADDTAGTSRLSADGGRVAYVQTDGETSHAVVLSREDGTLLAQGDDYFSIASYEFAPQGNALYVIGETEEGDLALSLVDADSSLVARGQGMQAAFSPDGQYLIYLTSEEPGNGALFVHPLAGGEDLPVLDGGILSFALARAPDGLLIHQMLEGENILYHAETSGDGLTELASFDRISGVEVYDLPDDARIFLRTVDDEGRQSLSIAPTPEEGVVELIEDWADLMPLDLSPDGRQLVFLGREESSDDSILYSIALQGGAPPVELDDDFERVLNALFAPDGRELLYTVLTGPDADEVEVRTVSPSGRWPFETLYPEAALEAASWGTFDRFASSSLMFLSEVTTSSLCPGALTIAPGETLEDELAGGERNCYRFRAGDLLQYTVGVLGAEDFDSRLEIYDRRGNLIASDDDGGPGLNPRLRLTLETSGLYYIYVFGYSDDDSGPYSLMITEGLPATAEEQAVPLLFDETVHGAITTESEIFIEQFDTTLFAALYYFESEAGEWIVVDLAARSIGSSIEPVVGLFTDDFEVLTFAETVSGDEPQLFYSIPDPGRYYLLVFNPDESYGQADEAFFEITLTRGEPPEPGGGPIEAGETVEGNLQREIHDEWTFSAAAGDFVTITMSSDSFDTVLELYDSSGVLLTQNDDSGGTLNSMIRFFQIPANGAYTIRARSYSGTQGGPYTLSLESGGPSTSPQGTIELGETIESELELGEWAAWTFDAVAGQRVTIRMTSEAFDSFLELLGPDGSTLIIDDDGAGFPNAMIDQFVLPETGLYTIIARCLGDQESGSYLLSLEEVVEE